MSIEEKVEEHYKAELDRLHIRHYSKTEEINPAITRALKNADSKSGGTGNNYPDIQVLLQSSTRRDIPVMIEAKGSKGKLEKLTSDGEIELKSNGKNPNRAVQQYAVNGALHYGLAVLDEGTYSEVIIIGINGTELDENGDVKDPEAKAYYVSKKNSKMPKPIPNFSFERMKKSNIPALYAELDTLSLNEAEKEALIRQKEETLEEKIKSIHQKIYDDPKIRTLLTTNDKLYLFCGLIMAGLSIPGVRTLDLSDLYSNDDVNDNDGAVILTRVKSFLLKKKCSSTKIGMVLNSLQPVFTKKALWKPNNGVSIIKDIYTQVKRDIIPLLESNIHLDFTGKILNSLNDWVSIENDKQNDVVLTPRMVTDLMIHLCRTDMDTYLVDDCMGSGGFLVSGMKAMIADAEAKIKDKDALAQKEAHIQQDQILGVEILGNIFILAVLNMILMGDGSSGIYCSDSMTDLEKLENGTVTGKKFPATVCALNPPYGFSPSSGLEFLENAMKYMTTGYAAVLIKENAGSGQGAYCAKRILKNNTLLASIHMPADLFSGKASVQTAIYLFKVNRPHEADDMVTFVDFSEDGYTRQNRKKSSEKVNLRNTDHALERYAELEAIILGKKPKTHFYTEDNGKVIRDTVSLEGNDWTFNQHKKIELTPTEEDFKETVASYLSWRVSTIMAKGARL